MGISAKIVYDMGIVAPHSEPEMPVRGLLAMIEGLHEIEMTQIRTRIGKNFTLEKLADKTEKALRGLLNVE